ncbi:MAG: hypothetical protein V4857_18080 [Pseudomonadota bacterium]
MAQFAKIIAGLLFAGAAAAAHSTDPTLTDKLRAERSAVSIENGRLAGPGAVKLREALGDSQFVVTGELHGIKEVADFSGAYFSELAADGFKTLAIEGSPAVGGMLHAALRGKDPLAAISGFRSEYPFALRYYDYKSEADLLVNVARAAGPTFSVIGFDSESLGGSKHLLAQMAREPINGRAQAMVSSLIEQDAAANANALKSGNPKDSFMFADKDAQLIALRQSLTAAREKPALAMLDALIDSRSFYVLRDKKLAYDADRQRAQLMKRNLAKVLAVDPSRKILVKTGAFHAIRGYSPGGALEPGNYLAEHAEGRGATSLHVMVIATSGTASAVAGLGRPASDSPIEAPPAEGRYSGFLPFFTAAATQQGWALYDLRPLRQTKLALANPGFDDIALGFDFALIITGATASPVLP